MARTERTAAILLRSVAYRDSDRIVTLLTASHGKLGAIARGARKSTKRFAGALEPFCVIEAELAHGRGDLARLASARLVRAFPNILADLARMSVAAAGLELVRLALADRDPPEPRMLSAIERFFELAESRADEGLRLSFAMRVLALVGLTPGLERCGRCSKEAPAGKAALFDPALGSVVCRACGGGRVKLGGGLREKLLTASGDGWEEVATMPWTSSERRDGAEALDAFAEHHLGRRLAAGAVVAQVREVQRQSTPEVSDGEGP